MYIWIAVAMVTSVQANMEDGVSVSKSMDTDDLQNLTISEEKRLTQYLLRKLAISGRDGRPIVNMSASTEVRFGLGLIQMDLDERNKILTCSMWSKLQWRDVYLTWNPADFGNVTVIRLSSHQVWIPDIMLYNTADPENAQRNALVLVTYQGILNWIPHQSFKSSCSIDVTNFPFDNQACHLWFGSWTHTLRDIDLSLAFPGGIDLSTFQSDYKDSCEWEIISTAAEKQLLPENDTDPVAVLTFTLNFRRKIVFSSYILTLPCVFLATLTLVVFCLPADRPDRIGLAMSLFASFLVMLLILVEAAPPTASSVPILGVYYCFNMVIIMLSIFLSSLVINIYRAGNYNRPVPPWLKVVVVKGLGRVLCRRTAEWKKQRERRSLQYMQVDSKANQAQHQNGRIRSCLSSNMIDRKYNFTSEQQHHNRNLTSEPNGNGTTTATTRLLGNSSDVNLNVESDKEKHSRVVEELMMAFESVLNNMRQQQCQEKHSSTVLEWREVGVILDRFFCLLFFVMIIVSLVVLFPRPPGLMDFS